MKDLVLLIDDDKDPMNYYVDALQRSGYEVVLCYEPDSALEYIKEKRSQIKIIVFDVMMPSGQVYKNENTRQGLITGVFLLKDIRRYCPNIPIIVFTNVRNPKTLAKFQEGPLLSVMQKIDYLPFELVEAIKELTNKR